jgi:membrane-anchored protein YejM (alkaline phosphatase superfamily)
MNDDERNGDEWNEMNDDEWMVMKETKRMVINRTKWTVNYEVKIDYRGQNELWGSDDEKWKKNKKKLTSFLHYLLFIINKNKK